MLQWRTTAAYLSSNIPAYSFTIVPLDYQQIKAAVRDDRVDFIVLNPTIYVELEALNGATRIATLKKSVIGVALGQFSGAIFCRSDREDIHQLSDIKGKNFLAVDETSLGGWQMAWYELQQQGIDPYKEFSTLGFAGTHDAVVYAVLDNKTDAGAARSDTLEQLARSGKIDISQLRILNKRESGPYPSLTSTALYPEWPIARLKNTNDELSNAVAIALLNMPPNSMAARDADIAGWTTPLDYTPVHTLMRELHLGPYRDYGKVTWSAVWTNYRYVIIAGAIALFIIGGFIVVVVSLNRRLNLTHKSSELLRTELDLILNSAGDGIFGLDNQGRHTFINAAGAAMLGYRSEELSGKPSHETWHHTGKDGHHFPSERCPIYLVYRDGKTHAEDDDIFWRKDGSNFPVEYMSTPIIDGDRVTGAVVVFKDITRRKEMERQVLEKNEELERNRSGLQSALDQLSILLDQVIQNKDLSVRFKNPHLKTCREVMKCGKTSCPCYAQSAVRCWQVAGTYCGGKSQGVFAEKFGRCSDCPVYREATVDPIYMIGENFNNMMHILEVQHQDLEKAYQDLQNAQSTILQQEKMASIGQLAAGVAHEINNPTGFIMTNLGALHKYVDKLTEFIRIQGEALIELATPPKPSLARGENRGGRETESIIRDIESQRKALKVDFITDDLRNLVKESLDGADRIKKIVYALKSFSRIDESEIKMADINAGIESTINIVWNELKYKAAVTKEYGDIPQTKCNLGQINQVFMNILVNAAQAIEKQGEIRIRTRAENNAIKVTITDTGSGISKDKINRIFEPFFTTKEVGKGTGLGLSIAYDIVKKHNGTIEVQSEVGKGTTFTVTIPIVEK